MIQGSTTQNTGDLFLDVAGALVPRPYPHNPGFKRDGTSQHAAQRISHAAPTLRDRVLAALRHRPATADELAGVLHETPFSIRPRVTELQKLGKILETSERRRNASGRMASVWRVNGNEAVPCS